MRDRQAQAASDGSVAMQAGVDINIGLNYNDVRQLVFDLFEANFPRLSIAAADKAIERVKNLMDSFLQRISPDNLHLLQHFSQPSVQSALLNAQKGFAITGDSVIKELLVTFLEDRIRSSDRSRQQIELDEAIKIVPILTKGQINLLSLILLQNNTKYTNVTSEEHFIKLICRDFEYLSQDLISEERDFLHIDYTGSARIFPRKNGSIPHTFLAKYPEFFHPKREIEVKEWLIQNIPSIQGIINIWEHSLAPYILLNSVGLVIAKTNLEIGCGEKLDLSNNPLFR